MNIKLLALILLGSHIAYNSNETPPKHTVQYFFKRFKDHFATFEYAQTLFNSQLTDSNFINKASSNIEKLTSLLIRTTQLCKTQQERHQLNELAKQLNNIIEEHQRLTKLWKTSLQLQPAKLQRAYSATTINKQSPTLTSKQYASFYQPKKLNNEPT